jgi:hypothetical protein
MRRVVKGIALCHRAPECKIHALNDRKLDQSIHETALRLLSFAFS